MANAHVHHYVVEGHHPFPIDMLRYDASHPSSEADSGVIEGGRFDLRRMRVSLTHVSENRLWHPTYGRWDSFGWKVTEERS